jgi:hypothetical protein
LHHRRGRRGTDPVASVCNSPWILQQPKTAQSTRELLRQRARAVIGGGPGRGQCVLFTAAGDEATRRRRRPGVTGRLGASGPWQPR